MQHLLFHAPKTFDKFVTDFDNSKPIEFFYNDSLKTNMKLLREGGV